jgi:nitrite reductase/ring-hydroxylating ferredoxin subunit
VIETERLTSTPAGIVLFALDSLADGAARSVVIQRKASRFHGFVVRRGGAAFGYLDRCPHMGLPLAQELDHYLTADGGLILCSWHGALFDVEHGLCRGGPCVGAGLVAWPVRVCDGVIVTA